MFNQNTNYFQFFFIMLIAISLRYLLMSALMELWATKTKKALGFTHLLYLSVQNQTLLNLKSHWSLSQIFYLLLALIIHDTYYYWLHRLMHKQKFYRYAHQAHHNSVIVSAWTSFSFDLIESLFQLAFFYLLLFMLPVHLYTMLFMLIFMTVSAVINHLNIEVYPKMFRFFPLNQLIGATHHALHHQEFKTNFGLYFIWWDRWMKTESKNYERRISSKKAPKSS